MNKKHLIFILAPLALASCAKTNLLYDDNAFNSVNFDENYYLEWEGIKDLNCIENPPTSYSSLIKIERSNDRPDPDQEWTWGGPHENQFGYNNKLSKTEPKFSYGVTSKLFDGRVRCEGYYERSRVQLDKSGFAMFFPKTLVSVKHLALSCKGFSDCYKYNEASFSGEDLNFNLHWSFYIHLDPQQYRKITYNINIDLPTDNGGESAYIGFEPYFGATFDELSGAVAMSLTWECNDSKLDSKLPTAATDDYTNKEKRHMSLMLYEVFLRDSLWND